MDKLREKVREYVSKEFYAALEDAGDYLYEKWSRSEELDKAIDLVYNTVIQTVKTANKEDCQKEGYFLFRKELDITIFGINVHFRYRLYWITDQKYIDSVVDGDSEGAFYNDDDQILNLPFYTLRGEFIFDPTDVMANHELEHILQDAYRKQAAKKKNIVDLKSYTSNAYGVAVNIISDPQHYSNTELLLSGLIYYSDKHEQDAKVNEHYAYLTQGRTYPGDPRSYIYRYWFVYAESVEKFNEMVKNGDFSNGLPVFSLYGYTIKSFSLMVNKGLARLKRKINNIEKHFKNQVHTLKENRISITPKRFGYRFVII